MKAPGAPAPTAPFMRAVRAKYFHASGLAPPPNCAATVIPIYRRGMASEQPHSLAQAKGKGGLRRGLA